MSISLPSLPLSELQADFRDALTSGSLLLEAEPGAGKSTLAPLWALQQLPGEVWLVQPRVLAAKSLAARLASLLGEALGQQVGYQLPFDSCGGAHSRLRLMTPGVLLQRLLADPELQGVSCVMLDEIHERSVNQDTAWALLQEVALLRDDLSLVLMSATPDAALRRQLAKSLYAPGRCFPVDINHCPPQSSAGRDEPLSKHLLRALRAVNGWQQETLLVFLPGWRDIEACRQQLQQAHPQVSVYRLHSRVEAAEQAGALEPNNGARVILATNIAETSLTIADVTLVVDSGLVREAGFEQRSGVSHLETRRISRASAEQRAGRAGRLAAGRCVRLWAESEALVAQALPEIRRCDYLPLALRLAHWGTPATQLPWLEPPNPQALAAASARLQGWQFIDAQGRITPLGQRVSRLGTHPRIAAILLHSAADLPQQPWLLLLALALHFDELDAGELAEVLQQAEVSYRRQRRWQRLAARWQHQLGIDVAISGRINVLPQDLSDRLAELLVERLGRRTETGRYRLNSGVSVALPLQSDWALVLQLARRGRQHVGVGLAIAPGQERIRALAEAAREFLQVGQGRRRRWLEVTRYRLGGEQVEQSERQLGGDEVPAAILALLRQQGLAHIDWPPQALALLLRARWLANLELLSQLPPLDVSRLEASLEDWLAPFLTAASDMEQLPLIDGLRFYLGHDSCRQLESLAPAQLTLPSGRQVIVDYGASQTAASLLGAAEPPVPSVAAKLQEFFGVEELKLGELPLSIELLSPAGRPVAITRDLGYFWRQVYPQVRRELRGRYAKHPWPEDPLSHQASAKTKKHL